MATIAAPLATEVVPSRPRLYSFVRAVRAMRGQRRGQRVRSTSPDQWELLSSIAMMPSGWESRLLGPHR